MTAPLIAAVRRLVILGRPHWRLLGQAMGCMLVVGLTTGAYAFLMGPALRFLLTGGTQGLELVARVLPSATTWSRTTLLWAFPAVIIVIGGLKGVGYLGQFYFVGLFGQLVVVDLRRAVFTKLLGLSPSQL